MTLVGNGNKKFAFDDFCSLGRWLLEVYRTFTPFSGAVSKQKID